MEFGTKIRNFILLLLFAAGLFWLANGGNLSSVFEAFNKEKEHALKAENYKFTPVTRRDIFQKVLSTGTVSLKTGAEVKIGARISGQLEKLMVQIGDVVKAGDLIAVIEHRDLLARVARFRADIKAEEARLEKIRKEGPLEIRKDKAALEELMVQFNLSQKTLARNMELSKKGFVSASAVDEAQENMEVLEAKILSAREELKLQEMKLKNDVALQEAMVEKAKASLMEEETQLNYAQIEAPIKGVVAFISTQEGETVVAGLSAPTFVTLIDLAKLEVTVFVDETDIGRIKTGQKAVFTVDAYADKFFDGVVRDIHPKAVIKDNVVNYEVILDIDPENISFLRPEMTANVVITTDTRPNVLAVPKESVKKVGKKSFVIVKGNGQVVQEPVETGWRDEDFMEVVSGLNENDEVGIPIKPKVEKSESGRPRRP